MSIVSMGSATRRTYELQGAPVYSVMLVNNIQQFTNVNSQHSYLSES